MANRIIRCLYCRQPVHTITVPGYSTQWIHDDGLFERPPTYAAPNLFFPED